MLTPTPIIWRLKERTQLRRCFELESVTAPRSEVSPDGDEFIVECFAEDMRRIPVTIESLTKPGERRTWQFGNLAIQYRVLFPNLIVEVLAVGIVETFNKSQEPTS